MGARTASTSTRDLLAEGMSVEKVVLVPVWHEAAYLFSEQERAALAWAEEVTRVSETHASDEAYAAALAVFGEKDLVDLDAHDCHHERHQPHGRQLSHEASRQGVKRKEREARLASGFPFSSTDHLQLKLLALSTSPVPL